MNTARKTNYERQVAIAAVLVLLTMAVSGCVSVLPDKPSPKLEIARALITQPAIILLDEPFSGVDPIAVQDLQREILHLKHDLGLSILLTDHNVRQTLEVTDRSYIIHEGKVIAEGSPRQLINDPLVRKSYLGTTFKGNEFDEHGAAGATTAK